MQSSRSEMLLSIGQKRPNSPTLCHKQTKLSQMRLRKPLSSIDSLGALRLSSL